MLPGLFFLFFLFFFFHYGLTYYSTGDGPVRPKLDYIYYNAKNLICYSIEFETFILKFIKFYLQYLLHLLFAAPLRALS